MTRKQLLKDKSELVKRAKIQANKIVNCNDERDLMQYIENLNEIARKISIINQQIFALT